MQQKMKYYLYKHFTKNLSKERVITHNINSNIVRFALDKKPNGR